MQSLIHPGSSKKTNMGLICFTRMMTRSLQGIVIGMEYFNLFTYRIISVRDVKLKVEQCLLFATCP